MNIGLAVYTSQNNDIAFNIGKMEEALSYRAAKSTSSALESLFSKDLTRFLGISMTTLRSPSRKIAMSSNIYASLHFSTKQTCFSVISKRRTTRSTRPVLSWNGVNYSTTTDEFLQAGKSSAKLTSITKREPMCANFCTAGNYAISHYAAICGNFLNAL